MKKLKFTTKTAIALSTMLVAVIFCGCETNVKTETTNDIVFGVAVKIITIDSCEYIYVGNAGWGSHKGNCKFCAERSKK